MLGFDDFIIGNEEYSNNKLSLVHSKGVQSKYMKECKYIKLDMLGYEGLVESLCSEIALYTNLDNSVNYECGKYTQDDRVVNGCESNVFMNESEEEFISYHKLLKHNKVSFNKMKQKLSTEELITKMLDFVKQSTGLDSTIWLCKLIEFDYLIMNEDRHLRNIGVIYNHQTKEFKHMPIFDNGAGFLSNLLTYPLSESIKDNKRILRCKPFNPHFDLQLQAMYNVSGSSHLELVLDEIYNIPTEQFTNYNKQIRDRVDNLLKMQVTRMKNIKSGKYKLNIDESAN